MVATCACDEFPFPQACKSTCEVGETIIQSVNAKDHTASVTIRRGTQSQFKTVPLSALPQDRHLQTGERFTTYFKINTETPDNPHIAGFAKRDK